MNKILLALFVCVFTVSAFACGGGAKDKDEEKKLFEPITTVME